MLFRDEFQKSFTIVIVCVCMRMAGVAVRVQAATARVDHGHRLDVDHGHHLDVVSFGRCQHILCIRQ